jgi:hypothetical protein
VLVYLDRNILPEVVVLFLHPKGNIDPAGTANLRSRRGLTDLRLSWRAVKLWEVPAQDLLAAGDVGLIPWVPLAHIDGPPEPIFRECRARIDRDAPPGEHESLLVVTHFLANLKYNDRRLFEILGGGDPMRESYGPVLDEMIEKRVEERVEKRARDSARETARKILVKILRHRFGPTPEPIIEKLDAIEDGAKLEELADLAMTCLDLDTFQAQLHG